MSNNNSYPRSPWWPRAFGVLLALVGLVLLVGGVQLRMVGGSWYYLIAGAATLVAGVLLARAKPAGGLLYLVVVVATAAWALSEVGTAFWGLVPRLAPVLVLGLIAALAMRALRPSALAIPAAALQAVVLVAGAASVFTPHGVIANTANKGTEVVNNLPVVSDAKSAENSWKYYGRDADSARFAPFDQLNASNVDKLQVAWTYRTGAETGGGNED